MSGRHGPHEHDYRCSTSGRIALTSFVHRFFTRLLHRSKTSSAPLYYLHFPTSEYPIMVIQIEQLAELRRQKRQPNSNMLIRRLLYRADGTVKLKFYRELSQIDTSTEGMPSLEEISMGSTVQRASSKARRSLIRPISPQPLSHVESLAEFKYIFLQLVRCHRVVHVKTGSVHGDLNLHSLIFMRDEGGAPSGLLNDWDVAKAVPADEAYRMHTGIAPFMALDLLRDDRPPYMYRHDLESFLFVLIWCTIHFNLNGSEAPRVSKVVEGWTHGDGSTIRTAKYHQLFGNDTTRSRQSIYDAITPAFCSLEGWVEGEKFMAALSENLASQLAANE